MRSTMIFAASVVTLALTIPTLAQSTSPQPNNTASPAKEADKMKSGDTAGSVPNSSNPGANPSSDGNKTQDSRTTKNKDR